MVCGTEWWLQSCVDLLDAESWAQQQGGHSHSLIVAPICVTWGGQTSTGCNGWKHLCKNAAIFTANLKNEPAPELNFHRTNTVFFSHTQRHFSQILSH